MSSAVYHASNNDEFSVVLKQAAAGGGTILLAAGNYERFIISNLVSPGLIITSADPSQPAHVDGLALTRTGNITFAKLDIGRSLALHEAVTTAFVTVNGSSNIAFVGLSVHGSLDGDVGNDGYGMRIDGSRGITIAQSHFEALNRAVIGTRSTDLVISGNEVTATREGFGFGAVSNVVIEKNLLHGLTPILASGDHPDCIQFMTANLGSSSHVLIRDNAMINGGSDAVQGIFMRSTEPGTYGYSDFVIDNNLYYGGSRHGITVSYVDGVVVSNNSIIASPSPTLVPALNVDFVTDAQFSDNISPRWLSDRARLASFGETSLTLASSKAPLALALDELFLLPPDGADATLANFVTAPGIDAGFTAVAGIGGSDDDPLALFDQYRALHELALSLGAPLLG